MNESHSTCDVTSVMSANDYKRLKKNIYSNIAAANKQNLWCK